MNRLPSEVAGEEWLDLVTVLDLMEEQDEAQREATKQ